MAPWCKNFRIFCQYLEANIFILNKAILNNQRIMQFPKAFKWLTVENETSNIWRNEK